MIKINRTKLVPKLILVLLVFTTITGFAFTFVVAKGDQRASRLSFTATETMIWPDGWVPIGDPWGDGKFIHQMYYKKAILDGTIEEIGDFSGYDELYLHVKMDPNTFEVISIGKVTMYIFCDNGLEGTFYGSVIAKGTAGFGPFDGKYTLQGAGGFEGMKLFGIVWLESGLVNGLSGTILIPN
ncbi:MAG: hypothetical protein EAX91_02100 [Candidatus Lokiarchaeota archaeon]|nr:hypothetical protein [Candidatus Lokiarchaeota archaeon]